MIPEDAPLDPAPDRSEPSLSQSAATGALSPSTQVILQSGSTFVPGVMIGEFQILSLLGIGGMGAVYRARQKRPRREVALKIIRPGYTSPSLLRRFEHEAEVLGRLHHPGIAAIYAAGTFHFAGNEQPYLAMELVEGRPLNEYAAVTRLSAAGKVALMAKVCDAVQHAHAAGVVHRDLKPSNILVSGDGTPRVLDFGVARLTDHDVRTVTIQTDVGQIVGTVPYMSPEQASGDSAAIDARSDVYTLGAITYELLAGRLPCEVGGKMLHEAIRAIREQDPARLSSIDRSLRGDAETIVAKALEKDRGRRYQSAADLAADIRRHLADQPITARPPSTLYQVSKFARRNKALVTGTGVTFAVLVAGVISTSVSLDRATRAERRLKYQLTQTEVAMINEAAQRKIAEAALRRTRTINEFVSRALQTSDPYSGGQQDITVAQAMQIARRDLEEGKFRDDPETEAGLKLTIAMIMANNGRAEEAAPLAEQALAAREKELKPDDPDIAEALYACGVIAESLSHPAEALARYTRALEIRRKHAGGADDPDVASCLGAVANAKDSLGEQAEAERLYEEALAMMTRLDPKDRSDLVTAMNNLAFVRVALGKNEQAEQMHRAALEMARRLYPGDSPLLAGCINNFAYVLRLQRKLDEALAMYQEALAMRRRLFKSDNPEIADTITNIASLYRAKGRPADAEPMYAEAMEMFGRLYKEDHPQSAMAIGNLGLIKYEQDHFREALPLFERAAAMWRRFGGSDEPRLAWTLMRLGVCQEQTGDVARAEATLREAAAMYDRLTPGGSLERANTMAALASVVHRRGHDDEARALAERAYDMVIKQESPPGAATGRIAEIRDRISAPAPR